MQKLCCSRCLLVEWKMIERKKGKDHEKMLKKKS